MGGYRQKTLILYDFFEGVRAPACIKALFYKGFLNVCVCADEHERGCRARALNKSMKSSDIEREQSGR